MELHEGIAQLRKEDKRNFDQTIDLIVNLKGVDMKRDNINAVISIPHKIKDKKVAAFLTKKSSTIHTITQPEFARYKDKKELKSLVKDFDFFISIAQLMPSVASTFGKVLGPTGKMPSPQLGLVTSEDDKALKDAVHKINNSVKIKAKEASIKVAVGKDKMSDKELTENITAIYYGIVNALPTKRENVKSVMIKLTMGKPVKVDIK